MLHYAVHGKDEGPAVVFLHGFMGSTEDWNPIVDRLAADYRVLSVDLPGHGRSLRLPDEAYSMEGTVQALNAVLDEAGVSRFALVGYSMGGRVALHYAMHYPNRIWGLVLESASPGIETEEAREERVRIDDQRAQQIQTDFLGFLEQWYRIPLFASLENHDMVDRMIERRLQNDPVELARVLRGMGPGQQPSFWDRLPSFEIPTLVLAGAWDEKYVELTERIERLNPRICRVIVPDAGHNIHAERAGLYAHHIQRFLDAEA